MARHWERTLIVLGICLPVPLLALTGLAIPLPATVERIAAALVPWAETSAAVDNDALPSGVDGVIVRTADEGHQAVVVPVAASNPHSEAPSTDAGAEDGKGGSNGGGGRDGDDGSGGGSGGGSVGGSGSGGGGGGGGGGGTGQDPGGEDPGEEPDPVQDVVDDVEETVDPVVDETTDTVDDVVDSTGLEETVDSVLPDLGE